MSVHSTHYENEEDYLADLAWEYRKGGPNDPEDYGRRGCLDCCDYRDCCEQVAELGYPQCEEGAEKFEDEYEVYEAMQDNEFTLAKYGTDNARIILGENDIVDIQADYREWKNEQRNDSGNN